MACSYHRTVFSTNGSKQSQWMGVNDCTGDYLVPWGQNFCRDGMQAFWCPLELWAYTASSEIVWQLFLLFPDLREEETSFG